MRRLSIILGSLAALLAVLLPAATAQAATLPKISWNGVTVSSTGPTTCQIVQQTVTFTVTGLTGNPNAAWTVTAAGENGSNVVVTLPLGTVTRADNGVKESVSVGPQNVTAGSSGQITFFVKLFDPSGNLVGTVWKSVQDC